MAQFIFNPTQSYLPVYNQLQFGMTSNNYTRGGFAYLTEVLVDNLPLSTLQSTNGPGETFSNVDIHRVASTALTYDLNAAIIGATYTPNSIKRLSVELGETYGRILNILGITQSATAPYVGWTQLNVADTTDIRVGERVEIQLDDSSTTPYLNDFWRVVNKTLTSITIDDDLWIYPNFTQTGKIKIASEFFDASFNGGDGTTILQTATAHGINPGDTFLLNLDPYAFATIEITNVVGTPQVNTLTTTVGGITYSLISSAVAATSTASMAFNLAAQINATAPLDFTAYQNPLDRPFVLYIYSRRQRGDATVGATLSITTTGTISLTQSVFKKVSSSGPIGGWNSFSGIWKAKTTPTDTTITTDIPWQNSTITGSQRGSLLGFNNIVKENQDVIGDKWIMNHYFDYEDFFNYPLPPLALTEDPRDCQPFSDWDEVQSIDIMTLLGPTGSAVSGFTMRTTYPIGGAFFDYNYTLGVVKGDKEPRISFGVGPGNLAPLSTTFSTLKPTSYNITIYDNFGNIFYNQDFCYVCKSNEWWRVMWLNKWGAFDFYNFSWSDRSVEGDKNSFYRAIGRYNGTSWVKDNGERGLTTYDTRTFDKWLFYTDLLKRNEGEWLLSLFKSPEVYLVKGSQFIPIIITNREVFRFNAGNKIRQMQFEARLAYNNISQIN